MNNQGVLFGVWNYHLRATLERLGGDAYEPPTLYIPNYQGRQEHILVAYISGRKEPGVHFVVGPKPEKAFAGEYRVFADMFHCKSTGSGSDHQSTQGPR